MNRSRAHHYLPRFYLAGFTDTGREEGAIWLLNKRNQRCRPTGVAVVGMETDYNAIHTPAGPSDEAEHVWADLEGDYAATLDGIKTTGRLPTDDQRYSHLVNFVASCMMRVPQTREARREFDIWAAQTIVDRVSPGDFRVELRSNNHLIAAELRNFGQLGARLGCYTWVLWLVADADPDLITSDVPVMSAIFEGQQLAFPLSKRMVLFGFPEGGRRQGNVWKEPVVVDRERVLACNGLMLRNARQFVYSPGELTVDVQREYLAAASRVLPEG